MSEILPGKIPHQELSKDMSFNIMIDIFSTLYTNHIKTVTEVITLKYGDEQQCTEEVREEFNAECDKYLDDLHIDGEFSIDGVQGRYLNLANFLTIDNSPEVVTIDGTKYYTVPNSWLAKNNKGE